MLFQPPKTEADFCLVLLMAISGMSILALMGMSVAYTCGQRMANSRWISAANSDTFEMAHGGDKYIVVKLNDNEKLDDVEEELTRRHI